jgi:hypothetical protein
MNPHDELLSLTNLFPAAEPLFLKAEHIPSSLTPEPYKKLLVHDHHMTLAMESHHDCSVDVRVVAQKLDGLLYAREILLLKGQSKAVTQAEVERSSSPRPNLFPPQQEDEGARRVVQYGIVRFNLSYVTEGVRQEILAGQTPLGRVLINHNVLRHIDLGAILEIQAGPRLAAHFGMPVGGMTYGRMATIFCNRQPAVDLLEISAPLA